MIERLRKIVSCIFLMSRMHHRLKCLFIASSFSAGAVDARALVLDERLDRPEVVHQPPAFGVSQFSKSLYLKLFKLGRWLKSFGLIL